VAKLGSKADTARELAYRIYTICERKKRAQEAHAYNALVQNWPEHGAHWDAAQPSGARDHAHHRLFHYESLISKRSAVIPIPASLPRILQLGENCLA